MRALYSTPFMAQLFELFIPFWPVVWEQAAFFRKTDYWALCTTTFTFTIRREAISNTSNVKRL